FAERNVAHKRVYKNSMYAIFFQLFIQPARSCIFCADATKRHFYLKSFFRQGIGKVKDIALRAAPVRFGYYEKYLFFHSVCLSGETCYMPHLVLVYRERYDSRTASPNARFVHRGYMFFRLRPLAVAFFTHLPSAFRSAIYCTLRAVYAAFRRMVLRVFYRWF